MNAMAADRPVDTPLLDLTRRRIERALRRRERYRYVQPVVESEGGGWRVRSPCCSRRVDVQGGVIDIAWLEPLRAVQWRLHAREHDAGCWRAVEEGPLSQVLERLVSDPLHEFWI